MPIPQGLLDRIAYRISAKSRAKKYAFFLSKLAPGAADTILDVGVNTEEYSDTDNYLEKNYPYPQNITAVSLDDFTKFKERYPGVKILKADGRELPFENDSFAIAYSNAVIEHVGDQVSQIKFLSELHRVSRHGYLTTPNALFPIEIHTRIPLLHIFLPRPWFDAVLRFIGEGWAAGDYMHLLSERQLRQLFREAGITRYELTKNRFWGIPMTFTIVWHK